MADPEVTGDALTTPAGLVAVALTGAPGADRLVRRAAEMATAMGASLVGLHVRRPDAALRNETGLASHQVLLGQLGGTCIDVIADDVAASLLDAAAAQGATHLVVGASRRSRWTELRSGSVISQLLRESTIELHIIPAAADVHEERTGPRVRRTQRHPFAPRRRYLAYATAIVGLLLLTTALRPAREDLNLGTVLLLFLTVVVAVAAIGGHAPALVAAVGAMVLVNWFFTPPYGSVVIDDIENLVELGVFLAIGSTVAVLLERAVRRRIDVDEAQAQTARLARHLREEEAETYRLERANDLRTALLRAVSHDLRTPLSSIKASVSSLLQDDVNWSPDDTDAFLRTIDEETDRLDRLVGNLLDMGRVETGAVEPSIRTVAIDELVAGVLEGARAAPDQVRIEVPDELPEIRADGALLERALANLLENAMRHSPAGAYVVLSAWSDDHSVVIRLIDRGKGIDPDLRERAIEPFQRLGDGEAGRGVGLGMAVASGLVSAMGGALELSETPGGGLTASVTMPAVEVPPGQSGSETPANGTGPRP